MAYDSSSRGSQSVRLIAVHTAEGARTAADLGAYFARPEIEASSHVGIDATHIQQYVPYDRSAWTMRSANPISENAELCAFARWTREQWFSTGTVDGCVNPRAILDQTAAWIRARCLARNIPIRKLTPAQVAAGMAGVIGHVDWTVGMHDGTHTDPGSGFPWDYVISKAQQAPEQDGLDMLSKQDISDAVYDGNRRYFASDEAPRFDGRNRGDHLIEDTNQLIALNEKLDTLIELLTPKAAGQ